MTFQTKTGKTWAGSFFGTVVSVDGGIVSYTRSDSSGVFAIGEASLLAGFKSGAWRLA